MILHVVLLQPPPGPGATGERSLLETLVRAVSRIPSIARVQVGRRVRLDRPGYEQAMTTDFQYLLALHFEDLAGLRAYLDHPAHAALARHFESSAPGALAYDYEVADLENARDLLSP